MEIDLQQQDTAHPNLKKLEKWLRESTGLKFIITSYYRPGDPGVHGVVPFRAIDLKCRIPKIGEAVADHINENWEYDPNRPTMVCCIYHDVGRGAHLHLQVHNHTKYLGE